MHLWKGRIARSLRTWFAVVLAIHHIHALSPLNRNCLLPLLPCCLRQVLLVFLVPLHTWAVRLGQIGLEQKFWTDEVQDVVLFNWNSNNLLDYVTVELGGARIALRIVVPRGAMLIVVQNLFVLEVVRGR